MLGGEPIRNATTSSAANAKSRPSGETHQAHRADSVAPLWIGSWKARRGVLTLKQTRHS